MSMIGLGAMELLIVLIGLSPTNINPLPADPGLISAAPDECLLYFSWYGMGEPRLNSRSQTEQLFAEPEVGAFIEQLSTAIQTAAQRENPRDAQMMSQMVFPLLKTLARRPSMLFLEKANFTPFQPDANAGLIMNLGDDKEKIAPLLSQLEQMLLAGLGGEAQVSDIDGVKVRILPFPPLVPQVSWGYQGDYVFVAVGADTAKDIIGRLKTPRAPPAWLEQLHKQNPLERPGFVQYIHLRGFLAEISESMPEDAYRVIDSLGLTRLNSWVSVSGLDGEGYVSKSSIQITPGPGGVFSLLPSEPLTAADLADVPADSTLAVAFRLNLTETMTRLLDVIRTVNPEAVDEFSGELARLDEKLGFRLQHDLFEPLGDVWTIHNSPSEGGLLVTGLTAQVAVRDTTRLLETHARLLKIWGAESGAGAAAIKTMTFKDHTIYYPNVAVLGTPIVPAWCFTDNKLIVSASPQALKARLAMASAREASTAAAREPKSLASNPAVAAALNEQPIQLVYVNTEANLRIGYPILQAVAPAICMELKREGFDIDPAILPSVAAIYPHTLDSVTLVTNRPEGLQVQTRESIPGSTLLGVAPVIIGLAGLADARSDFPHAAVMVADVGPSNHLKQIAVGMHNYHDGQRRFPAPASRDADGKPLLSWRVHLLPYLDEQDLYNQFHLDEPWDSEHNKKLVAKIPAVYGRLADENGQLTGKTRIVVPVGDSTVFPSDRRGLGTSIQSIADGTSNTILLLELPAESAVDWTKPEDWEFDPETPRKGLFEDENVNGLTVGMADGSIRTIAPGIDAEAFKAMFTRAGSENDGEQVPDLRFR